MEWDQQNLDVQRVDFDLFSTLIWKGPWEAAIKNKRAQEDWTCFKKEVFRSNSRPSLDARR